MADYNSSLSLIQKQNSSGDWCGTYLGGRFYPLAPEVKDVKLEDIAHSLSQICRFNGHTKFFYSVAQHSVNVSSLLKNTGLSRRIQILGLLHDASEAYICDIPTPLKKNIPGYVSAEHRIEKIILEALHILEPTDTELSIIRKFDNAMLVIEANKLMVNADKWNLSETNYNCEINQESSFLSEHKFIIACKCLLDNY